MSTCWTGAEQHTVEDDDPLPATEPGPAGRNHGVELPAEVTGCGLVRTAPIRYPSLDEVESGSADRAAIPDGQLAALSAAALSLAGLALALLFVQDRRRRTGARAAHRNSGAFAEAANLDGSSGATRSGSAHPALSRLSGGRSSRATTTPIRPPDLAPSRPIRVRIPAIGVDTKRLTPIELQSNGALELPRDPAPINWLTDAPPPGSVGPAVLVGYSGWKGGRGVLFRIGRLRPGDVIRVTRADRRTATFTVRAVRSYPSTEFPGLDVFGYAAVAALRVVNCTGGADPAARRYRDNVVVYADLTAVS